MLNKQQYEMLISTVGVPVSFNQAKLPNTVTSIASAGFSAVGRNKGDEGLVNALGVNGKIITIKASDLATPPEKFDFVIIGNEKYITDSVVIVHEPKTGIIIGYRLLVKGK